VGTDAFDGFVQREINLLLGADQLAVKNHSVVIGINFRPEEADGVTIDRNASFQNDFFGGAAGSHAGISQKFLEPYLHCQIANRQFPIWSPECGNGKLEMANR
jgi:hypothetical protein